MSLYSRSGFGATKRSAQTRSKHSDAFAEAALDDAFRGRDLQLAHEPNFIDRPPHRQVRRLGEVVDQIAAKTGEKAVRYWREKAALALSPEECAEALSIARKIALKAGLEFPEDRERAA